MSMDNCIEFIKLIKCPPELIAIIEGNCKYPRICGTVEIYQGKCGAYVATEIRNLPCDRILGFHIFEGECKCQCKNSYPNIGRHLQIPWGSGNCHWKSHPWHAGDLPPLLSNSGNAFQITYTERFSSCEIRNKIVAIDYNIDDFTTQPFGGCKSPIAAGKLCSFC